LKIAIDKKNLIAPNSFYDVSLPYSLIHLPLFVYVCECDYVRSNDDDVLSINTSHPLNTIVIVRATCCVISIIIHTPP
jgi:hypothetical protein